MITDVSTLDKNFNYLYLDRSGKLGFDRDDSFLHTLTRIVTSILGLRDYNIIHLFPTAQRQLSKEKIAILTGKLARSIGLSSKELENIQKLSRYYINPKDRYTNTDRAALKTFIESARGNLKLNGAINQLIQMETTLDKVHTSALKALSTFSFKTTIMGKLTETFNKVEKLQSKLQKNGTLSSEMEEKFSMREMRELESVIQLAPIFRDFKKMGLAFKRESELGKFRRNINISDNTLRRVQNIIRKKNRPDLMTLIFYNNSHFASKRTHLTQFLITSFFHVAFQSQFFHASLSYPNNKNRETEVHIMKKFIKKRRTLLSKSLDSFMLNFDAFFDKYSEKKKYQFKTFYGDNWKKALKYKFGRILKNHFSNTEPYESLRNPIMRRFLGGIGLKPLFSTGDFLNQMQFSSSKDCICTEFVIKSLMQCHIQLKNEVKKDFEKASRRRNMRGSPYPTLPDPFTRQIMINALPPPIMASILLRRGLMNKVKRPKILDQILDCKEERDLIFPVKRKFQANSP